MSTRKRPATSEISVLRPLSRLGDADRWATIQGGFWQEGYFLLRELGLSWRSAIIATWYSLRKDDRGSLPTVASLAEFLGITDRRVRQVVVKDKLQEWTAWLIFSRLGGERLAEVDRVTFDKAAATDGTAADRRLFYERARVLQQDINLAVSKRTPVMELLAELRRAEDED